MKVVMIGREAALIECMNINLEVECHDAFDLPEKEFDGDLLIWRLNEQSWKAGIKDRIEEIKKGFSKSAVLNTRGLDTMNVTSPRFLQFFKELPSYFDSALTYEGYRGMMFCEWMGFNKVYNAPSLARSDIFDKFKHWEKEEDGEKRVAFGLYGDSPIRHFNHTAIIGNHFIKGLDVKRVAFAVEDTRIKAKTTEWLKEGVHVWEKIPQEFFLEEVMKMRFCVYALTGRFCIQAQALGVPFFGGLFADPHDTTCDSDIYLPLSLNNRGFKGLKETAHLLIADDDYRTEVGKLVHEYALKTFHPGVKSGNMKKTIKMLLE